MTVAVGSIPFLVVGALVSLTAHGAARGLGAPGVPDLAFTRVDRHGYAVWVARADGSSARKVVAGAYGGSLSADGRWLAFVRAGAKPRAGLLPVYVTRLGTSKVRRIGYGSGERWSPTEARLAVTDHGGVFLADPATEGRRRVVRGRHVWQIGFSPDGRALAYAKWNGRVAGAYRSDVFAVGLADGTATRLTRDGHSESPLWGPRWIVYRKFRWEGGLRPQGRLWIMRRDGSGKRMLARGSEGLRRGFPVFGLEPLALSNDGRRLLACQAFEFGCPRVTVTIPGGARYGFPRLARIERERSASAQDLSSDGTQVLVDVGSPHDNRHHAIYAIPFAGGTPRLVARDALEASWRP